MKKTLLFATAIAFAMSMNAQSIQTVSKVQPMSLERAAINAPVINKELKAVPANLDVNNTRPVVTTKRHAAAPARVAQNDLYGTYLEDYNYEEAGVVYSFPVTVDPYEYTDENGQTTTYVQINGGYTGWGEAAVADFGLSEEGKLTVYGGQEVGVYNDQYPLYLFAAYTTDEGFDIATDETGEYYADLVYSVNEDENGTYLSLDNEGWVILAYDPSAESFLGYVNYSLDGHVLNAANAKVSYYVAVPTSAGWGDWEEKQDDAFVENFGDACTAHGFYQQFVLNFNLDAENYKATVPNCQPMYYYSSNDLMFSFYAIHDNAIDCTDDSYESVGYYDPSTDYIVMGDINTETGDVNEWDYFAFCTPYEEGVGAYWMGEFVCLEVIPYEIIPEGINTVLSTEASKAVYNLAGQRAKSTDKGILIQNGKKYFNF